MVPLKLAAGSKVMVPSAAISTEPSVTGMLWAAPVRATPLMETMLRASPSRSVSLLSRSRVTVPSSSTVKVSSVATGASLTGVRR
jgi:hypothetical protein